MATENSFDSLLVVSFGGPEGPDDVIPFLENVLRGRNVPRERLLAVAEHYKHFGGISPINEQCRDLISALKEAFAEKGIELPIYWGNRNWHPMLDDTVAQMKTDGVQNSLAFFTSTYSCYSGCRQYRENLATAQEKAGEGAPEIRKLRFFFNHPLFVEAMADQVNVELAQIDSAKRDRTRLMFTAHSIPTSMAENCNYEKQLTEASRLVAERLGSYEWELVYQSRSGPPQQPWLEPDVCDRLEELAEENVGDVVVVPIGFLSDHMEVLFDLDTEAKETCDEVGISMRRAKTVGVHPKFIEMICDLVMERINGNEKAVSAGCTPMYDVCPKDCCLPGKPFRPTGKRPDS
jgi:ferrochelatase